MHPERRRRPRVGPEILRQVRAIELRTRRLVSTLFSGEYRSVFRGQGIEFAEVRAYEQGDDYRAIDWNVSARMGAPYVKTVVEERELTLLLGVDRSGSGEFGRPVSKADRAVRVAAGAAAATGGGDGGDRQLATTTGRPGLGGGPRGGGWVARAAPCSRPGRPEGAEAQTLRALYAYIAGRFG